MHAGEIVAVTGPNGAGKSTLLRHLNGLLQPLAGSVRINGRDIAGLPAGQVAADVGLLFQDPRDQLFERTVEREVGFGLVRPGALRRGPREMAPVRLPERCCVRLRLWAWSQRQANILPSSRPRSSGCWRWPPSWPGSRAVMALDEPTVALDRQGLTWLDAAVRQAAADGCRRRTGHA